MKRFLAVLSALGGVGIVTYSIYMMAIVIFPGEFLTRNLVFLFIGILLLVIALWVNITVSKKNRSITDEHRMKLKKRYKTAAIVLGALSAFAIFYVALPVMLPNARNPKHGCSTSRHAVYGRHVWTGIPI